MCVSEHHILTVLIISIAFFGESMFGFGGGLIAIPLLSIFMSVSNAVTLVLVSQFCMGLLIFGAYKDIDKPVVLPITASLILGTVAGTLMLSAINPNFLRLTLAVLIIIFLVKTYFVNGLVIGKKHKSIAGNIAGLGGGLFQGLIGTGGPVLTMYLPAVIKEKAAMRASLIYLFFIGSIVRVVISVPEGLFTEQLIRTAAIVLPFFLLAITLGQINHNKVSESFYRQAINLVLLVSAVALIAKAL
jgi:uncharacterized membrane protein YfcA